MSCHYLEFLFEEDGRFMNGACGMNAMQRIAVLCAEIIVMYGVRRITLRCKFSGSLQSLLVSDRV